MEIGDITLHLQDIVRKGRRLILHVNIHSHHRITLLENSAKGQPRISHGSQAPDLKVMHIHGVIDMPERVAFVVANSNLAVSFGGHAFFFLFELEPRARRGPYYAYPAELAVPLHHPIRQYACAPCLVGLLRCHR